MSWQRISPEDAAKLMAARAPVLLDVRDAGSYAAAHIPGAIFIDNQSVQDFVASADKTVPVLVYCYHGNSSQGASAWLSEKGFAEVYSLDGGFEVWRWNYPTET